MKVNLRWCGRRVRCNTDTARRIGVYQAGERTETLYRNKDGVFFLHQAGGDGLYRKGPGGRTRTLSEEETKEGTIQVMPTVYALEWCQKHLTTSEYAFLFDGMPEIDDREAWEKDDLWQVDPHPLTERFTCSLASGLVNQINRAAEQDGVTKSKIVELALIQYFAKKGENEL